MKQAISSDKLAKATGRFSPAVCSGNLLCVSGQIGHESYRSHLSRVWSSVSGGTRRHSGILSIRR